MPSRRSICTASTRTAAAARAITRTSRRGDGTGALAGRHTGRVRARGRARSFLQGLPGDDLDHERRRDEPACADAAAERPVGLRPELVARRHADRVLALVRRRRTSRSPLRRRRGRRRCPGSRRGRREPGLGAERDRIRRGGHSRRRRFPLERRAGRDGSARDRSGESAYLPTWSRGGELAYVDQQAGATRPSWSWADAACRCRSRGSTTSPGWPTEAALVLFAAKVNTGVAREPGLRRLHACGPTAAGSSA